MLYYSSTTRVNTIYQRNIFFCFLTYRNLKESSTFHLQEMTSSVVPQIRPSLIESALTRVSASNVQRRSAILSKSLGRVSYYFLRRVSYFPLVPIDRLRQDRRTAVVEGAPRRAPSAQDGVNVRPKYIVHSIKEKYVKNIQRRITRQESTGKNGVSNSLQVAPGSLKTARESLKSFPRRAHQRAVFGTKKKYWGAEGQNGPVKRD